MAKTATVTAWTKEEDDGVEISMEMAIALRHIAGQIEEGYTSGHYPNWELVIEGDE